MGDTILIPPDQLGAVQQLKPQASEAIVLTPETTVLCIHRGRNTRIDGCLVRQSDGKPERRPYLDASGEKHERHPGIAYVGDLVDAFDSRHYIIAPGYFSTQLGAARHFKARAVVPGTRNPETRYETSFIAIIGVAAPAADGLRVELAIDDPEQWAPFTDEALDGSDEAVDALDRAGMVDPIDGEVTPVPTRGQANVDALAAGRARAPGAATAIEGTGLDKLKAGNTEPNEAVRESRANLRGGKKDD